MELINIKINVQKIIKEKLYKGEKGTYLDCVLIPTPQSKFGKDYAVVQKTPQGEDTIFLGDATIYETKKEQTDEPEEESDLPF